jgi:hypothetical protein
LHISESSARNKSLFAAFSSEKEDSFFFEKRTKKLLLLALHCPKMSSSGESVGRSFPHCGKTSRSGVGMRADNPFLCVAGRQNSVIGPSHTETGKTSDATCS